ncbi:MAG TPA: efflux RND transporter permease subunit, partial [Bradyrhizobium sp.]
ALAIPLAIVGTFAGMYMLNYSIDNLSLMAMTIAVGFVVDDAIVMLENIYRHIEAGMSPMEAALKGSSEIGFTIVSMSLSLVAVFIPLLLMGGLIGRLFREFAVTVSVAILMSGVISLTLTPMMCGWMLRSTDKEGGRGRLVNWLEAGFKRSLDLYAMSLRWSLRHRLFIIAAVATTMAANVYLYIIIPKGFFRNYSPLCGVVTRF